MFRCTNSNVHLKGKISTANISVDLFHANEDNFVFKIKLIKTPSLQNLLEEQL